MNSQWHFSSFTRESSITSTSTNSQISRKSPRSRQKTETTGTNTKKNKPKIQTKDEPHKLSEHSLESLDPMRSIRNLHIQQQQNHVHNEVVNQNGRLSRQNNALNISLQEPNLIMFTPPLGQYEVPQGATGKWSEPKKQRSPRRRKERVNCNLIKDSLTKTDHKKFHTSHQENKSMSSTQRIPVCRICSYQQEGPRSITDYAQDVVREDIGNIIVR